jgi:uncharacterized protein YceH (UPF0502 family)
MALFFDAEWCDARLAERGLTGAVLAAGAGLSEADISLVYKDQREVTAREVAIFAELLGVAAAEVASRAGVSTPAPAEAGGLEARVAALERRLAMIEAALAALKDR